MLNWRISKYNPKFRNEKSEYKKDEWTSCYDIGKVYNEKEFSVKDYMAVENSYINVLLSFLDITNTTVLIVKNLEKYNDNININGSSLIYTEEMIKLFESIEENSVLDINYILNLSRLILSFRAIITYLAKTFFYLSLVLHSYSISPLLSYPFIS